jgi:glucosamine--fructose-6-phosphate aminotransferase (isomerizing)
MCGIIGAVAKRDISELLILCLKRLEYRGYDSAGMVVINDHQELQRLRSLGKVQDLETEWRVNKIHGNIGLSHTRWATHGKPSVNNAHPHISNNEIAIVHNGIIENNESLRKELQSLGYKFSSETDTEVAAHLIHKYYQKFNDLKKAVLEAAKEMHGAFALGVVHKNNPGQLIAIRRGSPLVIGIGLGENFIASDPLALAQLVTAIVYVEEGESAEITATDYKLFDDNGNQIERLPAVFNTDSTLTSKGQYRHFMLKEIYEQSQVFERMLAGRIFENQLATAIFGANASQFLPKVQQIHIIACGTSYHAGLVAKYWIESLAHIPVAVEIASEYRYRDVAVPEATLFLTLSQSGETADTLAALRKAKKSNYLATLAICNVANSTLVREADAAFLTDAGPEIGVASTKAFTSQLLALLMLSAILSKQDKILHQVASELSNLSKLTDQVLDQALAIEKLASVLVKKNNALFIGRGTLFPIALEGALKLKEISYIHAEAYAAGELKHGPLALVDADMPVIALISQNELLDKTQSNISEVAARDGLLMIIADHDIDLDGVKFNIKIPKCSIWLQPILYTIPLQLLSYYVAVAKGTDVDQPRNLAKSVTVE